MLSPATTVLLEQFHLNQKRVAVFDEQGITEAVISPLIDSLNSGAKHQAMRSRELIEGCP